MEPQFIALSEMPWCISKTSFEQRRCPSSSSVTLRSEKDSGHVDLMRVA